MLLGSMSSLASLFPVQIVLHFLLCCTSVLADRQIQQSLIGINGQNITPKTGEFGKSYNVTVSVNQGYIYTYEFHHDQTEVGGFTFPTAM